MNEKLVDLIIISFRILTSFLFLVVFFVSMFNLWWGLLMTFINIIICVGYYFGLKEDEFYRLKGGKNERIKHKNKSR